MPGDDTVTRQPYTRNLGAFGWGCECHGQPHAEYAEGIGWRAVSPAPWCPNRRAVSPGPPPPKVRDSLTIRAQKPLIVMIPPPAGVTLPADVHRLMPRLLKVGIVPALTYGLHWWSYMVPIEAPDVARPPDADREENDDRDQLDDDRDAIVLPTGEVVRRKGRTTRDVPMLRETLALRAWPLGVVLWLRELREKDGKALPWVPDGGFVRDLDHGEVGAGGIQLFKQVLKEYERRSREIRKTDDGQRR